MNIEIEYLGELKTKCTYPPSGQSFETDAPIENFGKGEAISPTDLVAAAYGSCILTIMGIYAKKKKIDLTGTTARVEKTMSKDLPRRIISLSAEITSPAQIDQESRLELEKRALECPVHHSLHPDIQKSLIFKWGASS